MGRREVLQALGLLLAAGAVPAFAQAKPLSIGIIGTGRIGGALATHWTKAGHEVLMSSRHPEELRAAGDVARGARPRRHADEKPRHSARWCWSACPTRRCPQIGKDNAAELKGKVVLDTSNPVEGRDGRHGACGAEEGRRRRHRRVPGRHTRGARVQLHSRGVARQQRQPQAGTHRDPDRRRRQAQALAVAERLVRDAGFDPVVVGSLAQTRQFDLGQPLASRQFTAAEMRKAIGR